MAPPERVRRTSSTSSAHASAAADVAEAPAWRSAVWIGASPGGSPDCSVVQAYPIRLVAIRAVAERGRSAEPRIGLPLGLIFTCDREHPCLRRTHWRGPSRILP